MSLRRTLIIGSMIGLTASAIMQPKHRNRWNKRVKGTFKKMKTLKNWM